MKNKYCAYLSFLIVCSILTGNQALAQDDQFILVNRQPYYASGTSITQLKQDHSGYLWYAAPDLARFDGQGWKLFLHDPDNPNSVSKNISTFCFDADGYIWVGTKDGALDHFNPETGEAIHYFLGKKTSLSAENGITSLLETRDGTLWIGTKDGLYSRHPLTGRFKYYPSKPGDPHSLSYRNVSCVFEDRQGALWVATAENTPPFKKGGLNRLDRKTGRFVQFLANPDVPHQLISNYVHIIFEDSRGTLWVGTRGDGLHSLNRTNGQFTRYPYDPAHPEKLSCPFRTNVAPTGVSFIQEDRRGNLWIGANGKAGLLRYNLSTQQITRYHCDQVKGVNDPYLSSFSLTNDGTLFIGTVSGFVLKLVTSPPQIPFKDLGLALGVQAIYEDNTGSIWLGTMNGLFIHQQGGQLPNTIKNPVKILLENEYILSIVEDNQGKLWFGTWKKGLLVYDPKTQVVQQFKHDPLQSNSLTNGPATKILQDRSGKIWVPTFGGLNLFHPANGTFTHYLNDPLDSNSISTNQCVHVFEDYTGQLWIGTYKGINKMNRQKGVFKVYLPEESIFQQFEDATKTLWILTVTGKLYRYNRFKDQFQHFENIPGHKPITDVKIIIEDDAHNLWLGTRFGIIRLNPNRTVATSFDENYGFRGAESVFFNSCLKARDGKLYMGGEQGIYHFYPHLMQRIQAPKPQLVLQDFKIRSQRIVPGPNGPLYEPIDQTQELRLKYHQASFSVAFVALDMAKPEQIQYTFKLDNYDTEWRNSGERLAIYSRVPPGQYVFRVKAVKPGSDWVERTLVINISPPWWQRWWAYLLFTGALVGAIWGLMLYRSAALRRKNLVLEDKIALRTHQLQQSLENLKSTQAQLIQSEKLASLGELTAGIAHEIQNPLNFVNNFAEVSAEMLGEMKEEIKAGNTSEVIAIADDLEQNLSKINHHGLRASSIVKGMLEHSRASTGVKEPTDLNALADEYLRLAYHGLRAKDNNFDAKMETHFDPDLPKVSVIPQDIGRVLLNLINNAFYAVAERSRSTVGAPLAGALTPYQPTVTVSTQKTADQIIIRVQDNGNGIPEAIRDKIFQPFFTTKPTGQGTGLGLSLAYDIVTKGHGGTLEVRSLIEQYTEMIVQIPIGQP